MKSIKDLLPESKERFEERTRVPKDVDDRVTRASARTRQDAPKRDECWSFWRGLHFAYLGDKGTLQFRSTGELGVRAPGKPSWKSRLTTNLFRDHCEQQVSLAVQRVPSYDVVPSTTDPEDISAARLSRKVAIYGHEKWDLPRVAENTARHAVVGDEGFAWPFWDESVGPYVDDGEGGTIGLGEIRIPVFGANQVGWEPGQRFEESGYHYVEYAASKDSIRSRGDYMGGPLNNDATSNGQGKAQDLELVLVREYLERPCAKYPQGRWLTIANDRLVAGKGEDEDTWRPYPCCDDEDADKNYDGIVLHRLTQFDDSDSDRGQGLGRDLLDPMRIVRDCMNALIEWKDILLKPRIFMTPGALQKQRLTGESGQILQISQPNENVKVMDAPNAPSTLFEIAQKAEDMMSRIAAQSDPPAGTESAKAFQVWDERQKVRGYSFYVQEAKWYASVMRHCLWLVQRYYNEDRLMKIRGSAGWESITDFRGADLRNQIDVRVSPDSIEPITRQAAEQKIMFYAQQMWISPERAMEAIEQGTADKLIEDIHNDRERMNRIIQAIKQGPEVLFAMKGRLVGTEPLVNPDGTPNPLAGEPMYEPGWMPRPFDSLPVQKYTLETWMKSQEFDLEITDEMRDAAWQVYDGILFLEAQQQAQAAMAQAQMAEARGEANAAKDPGLKALPDQPAVPGGNPGPTMNQPEDQARPAA